jgi:hypothetical protein
MPEAAGIAEFDYRSRDDNAMGDIEAREASTEDAKATPAVQDPLIDAQWEN